METTEVSMKLVPFSGKKEDWDSWLFGFESRSSHYKYDVILSGEETSPTFQEYKAINPSTTDEAEKKKLLLYRLNGLAFSHLASSMDNSKSPAKIATSILRSCRSEQFPKGNAFEAIKALKKHYVGQSVQSYQNLFNEYNSKKLSKNQDPALFIAELSNIRVKIAEVRPSEKISDESFMLRVINNLPKEY